MILVFYSFKYLLIYYKNFAIYVALNLYDAADLLTSSIKLLVIGLMFIFIDFPLRLRLLLP
jgi:hypothetical protein